MCKFCCFGGLTRHHDYFSSFHMQLLVPIAGTDMQAPYASCSGAMLESHLSASVTVCISRDHACVQHTYRNVYKIVVVSFAMCISTIRIAQNAIGQVIHEKVLQDKQQKHASPWQPLCELLWTCCEGTRPLISAVKTWLYKHNSDVCVPAAVNVWRRELLTCTCQRSLVVQI